MHQIVDGLVELHFHKGILYDHADGRVEINKYFKLFTQLISCTGRHIFKSHKLDTTRHSTKKLCVVHKHHIYHESQKLCKLKIHL